MGMHYTDFLLDKNFTYKNSSMIASSSSDFLISVESNAMQIEDLKYEQNKKSITIMELTFQTNIIAHQFYQKHKPLGDYTIFSN